MTSENSRWKDPKIQYFLNIRNNRRREKEIKNVRPLLLIISNVYRIPYVPYPPQDLSNRQMRNCKIACIETKVTYDFLVGEGIKLFFVAKHRVNLYSVFLITKPCT